MSYEKQLEPFLSHLHFFLRQLQFTLLGLLLCLNSLGPLAFEVLLIRSIRANCKTSILFFGCFLIYIICFRSRTNERPIATHLRRIGNFSSHVISAAATQKARVWILGLTHSWRAHDGGTNIALRYLAK